MIHSFYVPACVPKIDGTGPYRPSPVQNVPTIMDRLFEYDRTFRLYSFRGPRSTAGYNYAICPLFANCLYDKRQSKMVQFPLRVIDDAARGKLANLSIMTPDGAIGATSQHN